MTEQGFGVGSLGAVAERIRATAGHPGRGFTPRNPREKQDSWSPTALPRGTQRGKSCSGCRRELGAEGGREPPHFSGHSLPRLPGSLHI